MTAAALIAVVLSALAGLLAGRAWLAANRRGGIGERLGVRASQHLLQGLHYLAAGHTELAISELTKVHRESGDSLEVTLVLGDLLREAGQVERAVKLHQELLERVELTRTERTHVLACLGMDYLKAGFIDRATRAFQEVLEIDPKSIHALMGLEKIQEDERHWQAALHTRTRLARLRKADDSRVLAHLQTEAGRDALRSGQSDAAETAYRAALTLDRRCVPAYLGLADLYAGGEPQKTVGVLEDLIRAVPDRAYRAFDRLAPLYAAAGQPTRMTTLLERLIQHDPQDWRARLALARQLRADAQPLEAHGLLLRALEVNPHAFALHVEMWRTLRDLGLRSSPLDDYVALSEHTVFYADPHICSLCRYRAGEALPRCPHCREWGTLVEERLAPTDARRP